MAKPRLLDLFCGAGGASVGYHRAGFDVVGVDIEPQKNYPFDFVQGNATDLLVDLDLPNPADFAAIHASPPCQAYSTMGNRSRAEGNRKLPPAPDLLEATWDLLEATGLPYVMENVAGAKSLMPNAFVLSGGQFGLGVHRPRYFVSNVLILTPARAKPPKHGIGVYGRDHDGRRLFNRKSNGTYRAPRSLEEAQEAMGMDWADWHGTKEAIPPAYSFFIGQQLIRHLGYDADDLRRDFEPARTPDTSVFPGRNTDSRPNMDDPADSESSEYSRPSGFAETAACSPELSRGPDAQG